MHTPEYNMFHHLAWTIGIGKLFHDSQVTKDNIHQLSPEDRQKVSDLVERYLALCDESRALSDHHKALSEG